MKFLRFTLFLILPFGCLAQSSDQPQLVMPLIHTGQILDMVFSGQDQFVASATASEIKLWETASGRLIRTIKYEFPNHYAVLGLSQNGEQLLTADHRGYLHDGDIESKPTEIWVWDTKTGKKIKKIYEYPSPSNLRTLAFSNDSQLALGIEENWSNQGASHQTRVWKISSGTLLGTFPGKGYFTPDGKQAILHQPQAIARVTLSSLKTDTLATGDFKIVQPVVQQIKVPGPPDTNDSYAGAPVEKKVPAIIALTTQNHILTLEPRNGQIIEDVTITIPPSEENRDSWFSISANGSKVCLLSRHGEDFSSNNEFQFRLWDTQTGALLSDQKTPDIRESFGYLSTTLAYFVTLPFADVGDASGGMRAYDPSRGSFSHEFGLTSLEGLANMLLTSGKVYNGGKMISLTGFRESMTYFPETNKTLPWTITLSPDAESYLQQDYEGADTLSLVSAKSGQIMWKFHSHGDIFTIGFAPNGQQILAVTAEKIFLLDLKGNPTAELPLAPNSPGTYSFSVSGTKLYGLGWNQGTQTNDSIVNTFDLQQGNWNPANNPRNPDPYLGAVDPNWEIKLNDLLSFSLIDKRQGNRTVATVLVADENTWIVSTPSGLFDASPSAMRLLHYSAGLEIIELDQLKDRYWDPGLLQKIFGYNKQPIREVRDFSSVPLYPVLEATIAGNQCQAAIELSPRNGGIGRLNVFINGREVAVDANPDRQQSFILDLKPYEQFFLPQKVNTLELRVYNETGWLKSRAITRSFNPPITATIADPNAPPSLYGIIVGTSNYSSPDLHLNYADHDASVMAEALQAVGQKLFGSRVYFTLLNTDPNDPKRKDVSSRENIKKAFAEIAQPGKAKAQDILVVYFSGHGVNYGNADQSQFYYLTREITSQSLENPEIRETAAISSAELTEWIKPIPALKQVLIMDACNSGKIVEDLNSSAKELSSSQVRAFDRMKDRTGMYILTGSAADKASYEATRFGQSLLTYSLLQGMSGPGLTGKLVDVMALFQYSRNKVPELARSIRGIQTPMMAFPLGGASIDIGAVDETVKIPLSLEKPVFIRNNFQEETSFNDVVNLTGAIEEYLQEITVKGAQAPLVYWDIREFKEGYSLKGRYTLEGDQVLVRARLFQGDQAIGGQIEAAGSKTNLHTLVEDLLDKAVGAIQQ
ncbi:MAG: caspase family protein [Lewinellaceae bacterium]|nr:caspase family protein [Lewinellaceae bacterium]